MIRHAQAKRDLWFVIAGHSASKTRVNALMTRQSIDFRKKMDARVKPAHDELIEHSRGALGMHVPVEIGGKSVAARRHARIVGKVRRVGAVMVGKPERPSALRRHGDRRRRADQDYVRSFSALYGRGPERAHVLDALATFQRSLLTPNARFDRYLNGQHDTITSREQRGSIAWWSTCSISPGI